MDPSTPTRPRWSPSTRALVTGGLLALGAYLVSRFSEVIPPLILASVLAYVLSPAVTWLQWRLRLPRGLATLLVYLIVLSGLGLLLALLVPPLVDQFVRLNRDLQAVGRRLEAFFDGLARVTGLPLEGAQVVGQAGEALRAALEPFVGQSLAVAVDVLASVVWVVFIFVISFYLVKDHDRLWSWLDSLLPHPYRADFRYLRGELNAIWRAFFRGQLVLALVVTAVFTVAGLAIGLPFSFAMAVFAGLMEFIPSLGHGIWLTVAVILTLIQGSTWLPLPNWAMAGLVVGLHVVFQQVDINYLIPRIIGRRMHLHPLVVILGILTGAALAGVLGILLAAPTIASLRVLGRYLLTNLLALDPEATPDPEVEREYEPLRQA